MLDQHGSPSYLLASLPVEAALLSEDRRLEACSDQWREARHTGNPLMSVEAGEAWPPTEHDADPGTRAELQALAEACVSVLAGEAHDRTIECTWRSSVTWHRSVVRLARRADAPGLMALHFDVTAWRLRAASEMATLWPRSVDGSQQRLDELVTGITHELNETVGASLSNAQALRRMLARTGGHAPLESVAQDVITGLRRTAAVIERFRASLRQGSYDRRPLDLNAVAGDVVQVLGTRAARDRVALDVALSPDLPSVLGDRAQLGQVVMHLLTNAVEATSTQPAGPRRVQLTTLVDDDHVMLRVDDSGPGFPAQASESLFQPFYTTKPHGLGVGLSTSRLIVSRHGGALTADLLPGGGARFAMTLPAVGRDTVAAAQAPVRDD